MVEIVGLYDIRTNDLIIPVQYNVSIKRDVTWQKRTK